MPLAPGALARIAVPNPHARVLELVGDVSGLLDPDEFCDGLFAALQAALPSDYVSLNQVASEPERNWSIVEPPLSDEHHATFYRLALQNPLAERFLRTRDGRPCASRTSSRRHSSTPPTIYREFYGPLQIEHQIAFALPSDDQHILAIAVVVAVNGAYDSAGHTGYPGAATPVGGGDNGLGGVSCPSGVVCQAVGSAFPPGANGSQAGAVGINNEVPASTQIVQEGPPGTDVGLAGVGCSVVGNCEAAGGSVLSSGGQFSNEEGPGRAVDQRHPWCNSGDSGDQQALRIGLLPGQLLVGGRRQ